MTNMRREKERVKDANTSSSEKPTNEEKEKTSFEKEQQRREKECESKSNREILIMILEMCYEIRGIKKKNDENDCSTEYKEKEKNEEKQIKKASEKKETSKKDNSVQIKEKQIKEIASEKVMVQWEKLTVIKQESTSSREGTEQNNEGKIIEEKIEGQKKDKEREKERKQMVPGKRDRNNNIIIKGLSVERENLKEKLESFLYNKLKVKVKIKDARIIGEIRKMIRIKLNNKYEKTQIMVNKSRLKGERIYIEADRGRKERDIQKKIVEIAKKEKEEGKKVKIMYMRVQIENKMYIWNEGKDELEEEKNVGGYKKNCYYK